MTHESIEPRRFMGEDLVPIRGESSGCYPTNLLQEKMNFLALGVLLTREEKKIWLLHFIFSVSRLLIVVCSFKFK
jgi:hypothetical protein